MTVDAPNMPSFPGGGRYHRLRPALEERFGERVHKVTLRGGFGCPNRDGRVGTGGCIFCSELALLPISGPVDGPVEAQMEAGLDVARRRFKAEKIIAYFQDNTATDGPIDMLDDLYRTAISHPRVVALSVGTRPDWIPGEVYRLLAGLAEIKPVFLELGLQSADDDTLRAVNRNHTVADFESAVKQSHDHGLEVIAHIILDLPGEGQSHRNKTADCLNRNRVEGVKIHNLHVLDGTPLAEVYRDGAFKLSSLEGYARMTVDFLAWLDPSIVIHRLTGEGPASLMLAPEWGRDKRRVRAGIERLLETSYSWQGKRAGNHAGA
jgi:radical SAM protein (TIGR01212 family)